MAGEGRRSDALESADRLWYERPGTRVAAGVLSRAQSGEFVTAETCERLDARLRRSVGTKIHEHNRESVIRYEAPSET